MCMLHVPCKRPTYQAFTSIPFTLQDVNLPMGPIAVHPASPAALARRLDWVDLEAQAARVRAAAAFGKTFSSDGEADAGAQIVAEAAESGPSLCEIGVGAPVAIVQAHAYARAHAAPAAKGAASVHAWHAHSTRPQPSPPKLSRCSRARCHMPHAHAPRTVQAAGDALLLDLRAFHFGTANRSDCARVQLSATFREPKRPDVEDAPGDSDNDGFTYELREELVGSRTLGDFLP